MLLVLHMVLGEHEKYVELRKTIINQAGKGWADEMRKDLAELMFKKGDHENAANIYKEISDF